MYEMKSLSLHAWTKYHFVRDGFHFFERLMNKESKKFKILPKPNKETSSDILQKLLLRGGKFVKSVETEFSEFSNDVLLHIAQYCPNLEELQLSDVSWFNSSLYSLSL